MLAKLGKWVLYLLATFVVLLAVAVGLLRILMPQLPEYRDEIIARISTAIDGDISFDRLDARWRLRGPEIVFHDVVIGEGIGDRQIDPVRIDTVTVGVSVTRLVLSREFQIRRVGIDGVRLRVVRDSGGWRLQDTPLSGERPGDEAPDSNGAMKLPVGVNLDVRLDNVVVEYIDALNGREALVVEVGTAGLELDDRLLQLDATLRPDDSAATRASVLVNGSFGSRDMAGLLAGDWSVSADVDAVSAGLLERVLPPEWRLPSSGDADIVLDASISDGSLQAAVVNVVADQLVPPGGGDEAAVSGRLEWSRKPDGWLCAVSDFSVAVADRRWPAASMLISLEQQPDAVVLNFGTANMTVYDLPYLASFLPTNAAGTLLATGLSGTLVSVDGFVRFAPDVALLELRAEDLSTYELSAQFDGLSIAPTGALPGIRNFSGEIRLSDLAGRMEIDARDTSVVYPRLFAQPVALDRLSGTLVWRNNDRGVSFLSDGIRIETPSLSADSSLELLLGADGSGVTIDVQSSWSIADLAAIDGLLPTKAMSSKLADWLSNAFEAGRIEDGQFELRGDLRDFPFDDSEGVFRGSGRAQAVTMRYARQWPTIQQLTAEVELDGLSLSTVSNSGISGGVPFRDAQASFADLRSGLLTIDTQGSSTLPRLYDFTANSPLRKLFGAQFDRMRLAGDADYAVALRVPLKAVQSFTVDATLDARDAAFSLDFLPVGIESINGQVRVDRLGAYAEGLQAIVLGEPISINVAPLTDEDDYSIQVSGSGTLSAAAIVDSLRLPLAGRVAGSTPFDARIKLPKLQPDQPASPVQIALQTTLQGLAIDLPYPVGKPADTQSPTSLTVGISDALNAHITNNGLIDAAARLSRATPTDGIALDRATIHLGEGRALLPEIDGLFVDGRIDTFRLGDWLSLNLDGNGYFIDNLVSAAVQVDDLYAFGQRVADVRTRLVRSEQNWLVDVQSEAIEGTISVPRDLNSGAPVRFEMERLKLLEADPQAGAPADPSTLPPLRIRAAEFALGDREFGALDAQIDKQADGLSATRLSTNTDAFAIDATGTWLVDPIEAVGSRTSLTGTVTSNDVKRMMNQLGYAPGINAESLKATLDMSWAGGPSADFVASLDGDVSISINNGSLDEVEPGAGRVVGLMSVAELPRRLALDFRDVFQKGFNFDEIVGDFRLVNGDAYTCNLSLTGSSADVGLVGRASLDKRNYNQTAIVSVKVGNTLPAVGAVVAGPQVGAALLLFSQIFKKPLRGMTEVYYQINGSWDDPSINRTDVERFVATSDLAGCLVDNGG